MDDEVESTNKTYKDDFLTSIAEKLGAAANASLVFAEPVEREGVTVIPVAKSCWGFGGGAGRRRHDDGVGGGGAVGSGFEQQRIPRCAHLVVDLLDGNSIDGCLNLARRHAGVEDCHIRPEGRRGGQCCRRRGIRDPGGADQREGGQHGRRQDQRVTGWTSEPGLAIRLSSFWAR